MEACCTHRVAKTRTSTRVSVSFGTSGEASHFGETSPGGVRLSNDNGRFLFQMSYRPSDTLIGPSRPAPVGSCNRRLDDY